MLCPKCGEIMQEGFCPLCGFKLENENNNENNKSMANANSTKNDLLITKNIFFFSLFSVLIPFLCFLFMHITGKFVSWNENSGVDSSYAGYLGYYFILEFAYFFLYKRARQTKCLNMFISHSIVIFFFATMPIFGLFYAFGFIFILPILLYCLAYWFANFIELVKNLYNASYLFRLCLFGTFIYFIIIAVLGLCIYR